MIIENTGNHNTSGIQGQKSDAHQENRRYKSKKIKKRMQRNTSAKARVALIRGSVGV
jgi:hypothetical protein